MQNGTPYSQPKTSPGGSPSRLSVLSVALLLLWVWLTVATLLFAYRDSVGSDPAGICAFGQLLWSDPVAGTTFSIGVSRCPSQYPEGQ